MNYAIVPLSIPSSNFSGNLEEIAETPITATASNNTIYIPSTVKIQPIVLENDATIVLPSVSAVVNKIREYKSIIIDLLQDNYGNRNVTWQTQSGNSLKWLSGISEHPISIYPNSITRIQFIYYEGRTRIDGSVIWLD